jgi:ubiquinone/menaquinone biosynthesis C-methylase UbiE
MKNTDRFSDRVTDYAKYRPDYPAELFSFIETELLRSETSVIADIGSGTGISSSHFLNDSNSVFAVEPNDAMRLKSEADLGHKKGFNAVKGTAEDTTLKEHSCDLIFCAQAFHWFDPQKALNEFERILKRDGYVALVWNDRNTDDSELSSEYEALINTHSIDYKKVNHKQIDLTFLERVIPYPIRVKEFSNYQLLDEDGVLGRLASSSYMPGREHQNFPSMLDDVKMLFQRHNFGGKVKLTYTTRLFYFTMNEEFRAAR